MPAAITHLLLAEKIAAELPLGRQRTLLGTNAAYWGSMGPDYLFFYSKDWPTASKFIRLHFEINDFFRDIKSFFDLIQNTSAKINDWLTGGLAGELTKTAQYLKTTINALVTESITGNDDYFERFRPPIAKWQAIDEWFWMDLCHHQRTGDYAKWLCSNARGDLQEAYALGYLTHIAGDVAVHPYVNLICGGPYRRHFRRHVTIEKFHDAHILRKWKGKSVSDSKLHTWIELSNPIKMPSDLAKFIADSLAATYGPFNLKSPVPKEDDIQQMYFHFHEWLEGATSLSGLTLPAPPPFKFIDVPNDIKKLFTPPPAVVDPFSGGTSDWLAFLRSLLAFILWAMEMVVMIVSLPLHFAAAVLTAPARYFLWLVQKELYEAYAKSRLALALSGYMHPDYTDLPYLQEVVTPQHMELISWGGPFAETTKSADQTYHLVHPHQRYPNAKESPDSDLYLEYNDELKLYGVDKSDPRPFFDVESALVGQLKANSNELKLAFLQLPSQTLPSMIRKHIAKEKMNTFGSARSLGVYLVQRYGQDVPNWNLDGDRGYGWPVWLENSSMPWSDNSFDLNPKVPV